MEPEAAGAGSGGKGEDSMRARMFTVLTGTAPGRLVFKCELPQAADAWVAAVNAKVSVGLIPRLPTFQHENSMSVGKGKMRELRMRNTQFIRL
jgi:hypothetical protein